MRRLVSVACRASMLARLLATVLVLSFSVWGSAQGGECEALREYLRSAGAEAVAAALRAEEARWLEIARQKYTPDANGRFEGGQNEEIKATHCGEQAMFILAFGLKDEWINELTCERVQELVGYLGKGSATASKSWTGSLASMAQPGSISSAGPWGTPESWGKWLASIGKTNAKIAREVYEDRIPEFWKQIEGLAERAESVADKRETAMMVYDLLVNHDANAGQALIVKIGAAGLPGYTAIPAEIVARLGSSLPDIYKALFKELGQVINDPLNARQAQEQFWSEFKDVMLNAYGAALPAPVVEAALRASTEQNASMDSLKTTFGVDQGLAAYWGAMRQPARLISVPGSPDAKIVLQAPESVSFDPPAGAKVETVQVGGPQGITAKLSDIDGDGKTDRIYADFNRDGRTDWVEYLDSAGSPWTRGIDTDGDGKMDTVLEREGDAKQFTHLFRDANRDGRFEWASAGLRADAAPLQSSLDSNGDGRADRMLSLDPASGAAMGFLDMNGDGRVETFLMSGVGQGGIGPGWRARAADADGDGYFERLFTGPDSNPQQMQFLDPWHKGVFTGMASGWNGSTSTYAKLYLDTNGDGNFDTGYIDTNADGRFDETRAVRSPVLLPIADSALRALSQLKGWWTEKTGPRPAALPADSGSTGTAASGGAPVKPAPNELALKQFFQGLLDRQQEDQLNLSAAGSEAMAKGRALIKPPKTDWKAVLECYVRASKTDAENAYVWAEVGMAFTILNRQKDAEAAYRRAVALAPEVASYWESLVNAVMNQVAPPPHFSKAVSEARAYVGKFPKLAWAHLKLADILGAQIMLEGKQELMPELMAEGRKALDLNPKDPDVWRRYGGVQQMVGRKAEAIQAMEKAVALSWWDPNKAAQMRQQLEFMRKAGL